MPANKQTLTIGMLEYLAPTWVTHWTYGLMEEMAPLTACKTLKKKRGENGN